MSTPTPNSQLDLWSDLAPCPRLSPQARAALKGLTEAQRAEVVATLKRHFQACRLQEVIPSDYQRVLIEAAELARLGDGLEDDGPAEYEPVRRYGQYAAPKAEWV